MGDLGGHFVAPHLNMRARGDVDRQGEQRDVEHEATTPWAVTVRRISLLVTPTSDTCDVMPITNEKYTKSQ